MIYNFILLTICLPLFAASTTTENCEASRAVVWFAMCVLLMFALIYPDAGRNWF